MLYKAKSHQDDNLKITTKEDTRDRTFNQEDISSIIIREGMITKEIKVISLEHNETGPELDVLLADN